MMQSRTFEYDDNWELTGCTEKLEDRSSPEEQLASIIPKGVNAKGYTLTQYINDINQEHAQVLMEYSASDVVRQAYIYGETRVSVDKTDETSYYINAGRFNVTGGNLVSGTADAVNYYGYNVESTNTNTGFQYLRARYYNPVTGTMTTEDTETGTQQNSLTRNRFVYVTNNPFNYQDSSGHFLKKLWNGVTKVDKKVVSTAKKVKNTATKMYQSASSAGSRFVKNVGNAFSSAGRRVAKTYTSFTHYVAERTAEIKENVVRELCTTANRITDALGKVDWKSVGKIAVGGPVIAGLDVATVLTGGTAAVIGGITSVANGDGFLQGAADGFMWLLLQQTSLRE